MTIISHGTDNDQNIVVQARYDRGGRLVSLRHPDGRQDALRYDQLNRRTTHVRGWVPQVTDPAQWVWSDSNSRWEDGGGNAIAHGTNDQNLVTRLAHRLSSLSAPSGSETLLTDALGQDTIRRFDPLGRLRQIDYGDPAMNATLNVGFAYDLAGNRTVMSEYSDAAMSMLQRRTAFEYDQAHRLNKVEFDVDGDTNVEQTVSYTYDRGGQRTTLTIDEGGTPLTISYQYDERGQLIGLSDWDSQATTFEYDNAGRHTATRRANDLDSSYRYDRASRLKELRHATANTTFARFRYTVDGRGNRVRAVEAVRTGDGQVVTQSSSPEVVYLGSWTSDTTGDPKAILRVPFASDQIEVWVGTGPNHSMFDIYLDGAFWGTVDGYEAVAGDRDIAITLNDPGNHVLEIRNRSRHSYLARNAAGFNPANYTMRFVSLTETGEYDVHDIRYTYDALSRLQQADYDNGGMVYDYGYDVAGNLVNDDGMSRAYNAVNQLVDDGTNTLSYDRNGNLVNDGVNSYTWDRTNRLLSVGNTSYKYDGLSNRIQQTVSSIVTDYLNDIQPGLTKLLRQDNGTNIKHFIHAPRGIHAINDGTSWNYYLQDGLGSVRNDGLSYSPVGVPSAAVDDFGFTGEYTNGELLYLRARYMSPNMGTFLSLDPFEGVMNRPMSLNGYSWVEGNTPNRTDATGLISFSDIACAAATIPCIASLAFVPDNAVAIGFAIDAATCAAAAAVCGTAKLIDIVDDTLGRAAADFLSDILGAATSTAETQTSDVADPYATPGAPAAPTIEAVAAPEAPGTTIPQGGEDTGDIDWGWPRRLAELCNQTGWCRWAIWELLRRLLQNIDPLVDPIDRSRNDDPEDNCPVNIQQIFNTPQVLAGRIPAQVECAFDGRWSRRPTLSQSGSVGHEFGFEQRAYVRWSQNNGVSKRHFRDASGNGLPYWKLTAANATPSNLWVAPDSLLFITSPIYYGGEVIQGNIWNGPMTLPPTTAALIFSAG